MFTVKLNSQQDVHQFVREASSMKAPVRISALNNTVVNASSVLGMLTLDLSNPIVLNCDDEAEARAVLGHWEVR